MKKLMKKLKPIETHLTGQEIIDRIRQGHMVRRSSWLDGFFIRICNERGYDDKGYVIYDRQTPLYTYCTDGYFLHFASSSQPFKDSKSHRDGEGIEMLFADDWENWGFISDESFNELTVKMKDDLRQTQKEVYKRLKIDALVKQGYNREELERDWRD